MQQKTSKHHQSSPMSAKRKSDSSCILRISDGFASFTVSLRFSFPSAFAAFPSCHGPMMHKHQRLIYGENIRKPHAQSPNHQNLRWCFDLIKNEGCRVVFFRVIHLMGPFSQHLHWIISQNQPHTSLTSTISDNFFLVSFQICILSFPEVKRVRSHWSVSLRLPLDHPNQGNVSTCPLGRHPNMLGHFIHRFCYHDFREFPSRTAGTAPA